MRGCVIAERVGLLTSALPVCALMQVARAVSPCPARSQASTLRASMCAAQSLTVLRLGLALAVGDVERPCAVQLLPFLEHPITEIGPLRFGYSFRQHERPGGRVGFRQVSRE